MPQNNLKIKTTHEIKIKLAQIALSLQKLHILFVASVQRYKVHLSNQWYFSKYSLWLS